MRFTPSNERHPKIFIYLTLVCCALLLAAAGYVGVLCAQNNIRSFAENVMELRTWTLRESAGDARELELPATIPYGADGRYALTCVLPPDGGELATPVLCFYSNYVDVEICLDGRSLYVYPPAPAVFSGATGNTYHFVRLPAEHAGKTLTISLRCQLGDDITYLIKAPRLGSKATILCREVLDSLPFLMLSGCMLMLALALAALYLLFERRFTLSNTSTYIALFALLFACYVFCETSFAQMLIPNGYLLSAGTLLLLTLMPIAAVGIFAQEMSARLKVVPHCLMLLCILNFLVQSALNFGGVKSLRAMVPITHGIIIVSIAATVVCLLMSDKEEKPRARRSILSAAPMLLGGLVDILLIWLERPSINNSFFFVLGVSCFVALQFGDYIRNSLILYRGTLENELLRDMAYRDMLTNIGNRNAYERRVKELSDAGPTPALGCVIVDINGLKAINDTLGHPTGDAAIMETGRLLSDIMPTHAACFRTGGDEYIILIEDTDIESTRALSLRLRAEAAQRGEHAGFPLSLAVGCGHYEAADGTVMDFLRRVDADMYACKRACKACPDYPFV